MDRKYRTIVIHIALWLIYALLTFSFVSSGRYNYEQSLLLTLRTVLLHAFIFYFNLYILLPRLMEKNRYFAYGLSIVVLLVLVYFLRQELASWILPEMQMGFDAMKENTGRPPRPRRGVFNMNFRAFLDMITSLAVLFFSTAYWISRQNRNREKHASLMAREKLENELKLLKTQINPHFLFNALNNIYSLSLSKSAMAPEMLVKLSEMLRYVLYESNEPKVPISNEIDYINHYIDFQKIKLENGSTVQFETDPGTDQVLIEPMIFIPFIENAFKHGNPEGENGFVRIQLICGDNQVRLVVENSFNEKEKSVNTGRGIGIENVRKRLSLLYPEKHSLDIKVRMGIYYIELIIDQ